MKTFEKLVVGFGILLLPLLQGINIVDAQTKKAVNNTEIGTVKTGNNIIDAKKAVNNTEIKSVKIGNQEWMASNLNVNKFKNGDLIYEAKTAGEWAKAGIDKKPAWCYYADSLKNGTKYGKLYNWFAVNDPRGIAPSGWHVPSNANWASLVKFLGSMDIAGRGLKDSIGWKSHGNGDNRSGFKAIPGGVCTSQGKFSDMGTKAQWWSTSVEIGGSPLIYSLMLSSFSVEVSYIQIEKEYGLSIRCIKD